MVYFVAALIQSGLVLAFKENAVMVGFEFNFNTAKTVRPLARISANKNLNC